MNFRDNIEQNPIIAAVRNNSQLEPALRSSCGLLFLLSADILSLEQVLGRVHEAGKQAFVHVDLMEGIGRDRFGIAYLRDICKVDGVLSTHAQTIRMAKEANLPHIQRLFMIDSQSIQTGTMSILQTKPNAVELMPGIMPRIIKKISKHSLVPIIAGGLVQSKKEVIAALLAGAIGVSTSEESLWNI